MSTSNCIEHRFPVFIRIFSRVPAYAYFLASVMTMLIIWVRPSFAPKMPPSRPIVRQTPKPRVHRTRSLKESTHTLIDEAPDIVEDMKDLGKGPPPKSHKRFARIITPVKVAMSPTVARVRRLSITAKEFSEHVATAVAAPFHHHHHHHHHESVVLDADSYPAPIASHNLVMVEARVGLQVEVDVVEAEERCDTSFDGMDSVETRIDASPMAKKSTKFKRALKKAKALLRLHRRR
ncbi:hypothetical protein LshimejAT787_1103200 [Lyophyllum shimeji]|uniref:Uncharacterized protein n=1 Tax=Lyophyllum shimeji TaxID=47721 RepID=A0A9P3PUM5_LYOSH|nr:hypothetical protein LshimejAT787_1103200 [Lyophyllum shimeji]